MQFFVLVVLAGLLGVLALARVRRRASELRTMAVQFGLSFSTAVAPDLEVMPFPLFSRGDKRRFRNELSGRWGGIELREFDLAVIETGSGDSGGGTTWYSCAVTEIAAWSPPLTISAETFADRIGLHFGSAEVPLESEQFSRTFSVRCADARFATAFLDARMMAWLLAHGRGWTFEVSGRWVLCYRKVLGARELIPLLGTLRGFADHVPRVVSELYGVDAPR
ncbi:MAG: hypothetical protein M3O88_09130 [Actinomycetota bacterium]|nr:hypothetical protein [Actinomycetota bacterium]